MMFNDDTPETLPTTSTEGAPAAATADPAVSPSGEAGVAGGSVAPEGTPESAGADLAGSSSGAPAAVGSDDAESNVATAMPDSAINLAPRDVAVGARVKGRIVSIGESTVFVDFGGRSEGALEASQIRNADGTFSFKVGDEIEASVASVAEGVTLTIGKGKSRKEKEEVDTGFIDAAAAADQPLQGVIKAVNKGGLVIDINGVRGFCPVAQIDLTYVADPSVFVGQHAMFKILQWDPEKKSLVVSRRAILQTDRDQKAGQTRATLAVGQELDGIVRRLAPFGAFIDLGGVEGLAHVSELSHSRVAHPSDVVKEGDQLRVRVIKIEDLGGAKERISLSVKVMAGDPWQTAASQFTEGSTVEGGVVRLTDFGAFVELAPGIDGLIHVSELAHHQVAHPRDAVSVGDHVSARVLRVDPSKKRISLSLKALVEAPAREAAPAVNATVGQVVEGTVASVKPYGVFVNLPSLGQRVSGLLPRAEMGGEGGGRGAQPGGGDLAKRFPVGSPVKAEISQIDEQGRIRLSISGAQRKSERQDLEDYRRQTPAKSENAFGPLAELLRPLKEKMESAGQ